MTADPKPAARVRDAALLRRLHQRWRSCALCRASRVRLSLHHVSKHPRDDVEANLVMLCGSGTTGCHGAVEAHDAATVAALAAHVRAVRPDVVDYLTERGRLHVLEAA